jgi:hypothetical protein
MRRGGEEDGQRDILVFPPKRVPTVPPSPSRGVHGGGGTDSRKGALRKARMRKQVREYDVSVSSFLASSNCVPNKCRQHRWRPSLQKILEVEKVEKNVWVVTVFLPTPNPPNDVL